MSEKQREVLLVMIVLKVGFGCTTRLVITISGIRIKDGIRGTVLSWKWGKQAGWSKLC